MFFIAPPVSALAFEEQSGFIYEEFQNQRYLSVTITPRKQNSPTDVKKLQVFLNTYEKESLQINGIYDVRTQAAVNRFQLKYAAHILAPWGITKPTGNVGVMTMAKINNIVYGTERKIDCPGLSHTIRLGQSSPDLPYLRRLLVRTGFYLSTEDSYIYDEEVRGAVEAFQERYGDTLGLQSARGLWHVSTRHTANLLVGCDAPEIAS